MAFVSAIPPVGLPFDKGTLQPLAVLMKDPYYSLFLGKLLQCLTCSSEYKLFDSKAMM